MRLSSEEVKYKEERSFEKPLIDIKKQEYIPLCYLSFSNSVIKTKKENVYCETVSNFIPVRIRKLKDNAYKRFEDNLPYYHNLSFNIKRRENGVCIRDEVKVYQETVFINDKIVFYIGVDSDYFLPHKGALERESIVEIPTQHLKAFIDYDFLFFKPYKKFLDIILYYYMVRKKEDLKENLTMVKNLHENLYTFTVNHSDFYRTTYELQEYIKELEGETNW